MSSREVLHLFGGVESSRAVEDSWAGGAGDRAQVFDLQSYITFAQTARRGVFDGLFNADRPELIIDEAERPLAAKAPEYPLEPIALFTALAREVPDISFIVTASTSFSLPYTLARQLQSAQILSEGRIIWNVISSFRQQVADNYGAVLAGHDDRYRRAEEFVEVVRQLWTSWRFDWDASEVPTDRPYAGAERIDFRGEFFDVAGPLNVPLPAYGPPVLCQAGGSPQGKRLAARFAEIVLGLGTSKLESQRYISDLRRGAVEFGRRENDITVLAGFSPIVLSSEAEVAALRAERAEQRGSIEDGITKLEKVLAVELRHLPLDQRLTTADLTGDPDSGWPVGVKNQIIARAADNAYSLRQLIEHDDTFIGTPEAAARHAEEWWRDDAADGLIVHGDLETFVDQVVPILQARGVTARDYGGKTLRQRLGVADWSRGEGVVRTPDPTRQLVGQGAGQVAG